MAADVLGLSTLLSFRPFENRGPEGERTTQLGVTYRGGPLAPDADPPVRGRVPATGPRTPRAHPGRNAGPIVRPVPGAREAAARSRTGRCSASASCLRRSRAPCSRPPCSMQRPDVRRPRLSGPGGHRRPRPRGLRPCRRRAGRGAPGRPRRRPGRAPTRSSPGCGRAPAGPRPVGAPAWDHGRVPTLNGSVSDVVRRQDLHPAGADPELLHHRSHRSRQVHARRPDAAAHRGRGGA